MIDMDGGDMQTMFVCEHHECHGIGATRNSTRHSGARGGKSATTKEFVDQEGWLLLFKSLALAPIGIFSGTDLDHIPNCDLEHSSDTCDEEDYTDPPMPNVCCQHAF